MSSIHTAFSVFSDVKTIDDCLVLPARERTGSQNVLVEARGAQQAAFYVHRHDSVYSVFPISVTGQALLTVTNILHERAYDAARVQGPVVRELTALGLCLCEAYYPASDGQDVVLIRLRNVGRIIEHLLTRATEIGVTSRFADALAAFWTAYADFGMGGPKIDKPVLNLKSPKIRAVSPSVN